MIGYGFNNNRFIAVGYLLPQRKKPCLLMVKDNTITKLATFNNEDAARAFFDFYAEINHCERIDWEGDDIPVGLRLEAEK